MRDCLQVDDRTVYELHHLSEHLIGGFIELLEMDLLVGLEERVVFGHLVSEDVPLMHHPVCEAEEGRRVQFELDRLNKI